MTVEARHQVHTGSNGDRKASVIIIVGVAPKPEDRPLLDLAEGAIELSLEQARDLVRQINAEADCVEQSLREVQERKLGVLPVKSREKPAPNS